MTISFSVAGDPKGQPRPRAFAMRGVGGKYSARVFDPGTAEAWKQQIAVAAMPMRPPAPFTGPVALKIAFVFRRPKSHFRSNGELKPDAPRYSTAKPDADNCAKAVMDALTQLGAFWRDDAQVVELRVWKDYGKTGGALVEISEIPL
jgi:Holliday junction resolvase RusA-like endonuclease